MKSLFILVLTLFQFNAYAEFQENLLDELDPRSPDIEEKLREFDEAYFKMTGKSPFVESTEKGDCYRNACPIWARVNLAEQFMYIYIDGELKYLWLTSTGKPGYRTPYLDENPNGRIYDRYTSTAYPGGDYNGLGNMPYAVFIRGGYAIHGTGQSNWPNLGKTASHGCIRLHPDNAFIFNRFVRAVGVAQAWVSVE
jgi:hypothetical protein